MIHTFLTKYTYIPRILRVQYLEKIEFEFILKESSRSARIFDRISAITVDSALHFKIIKIGIFARCFSKTLYFLRARLPVHGGSTQRNMF